MISLLFFKCRCVLRGCVPKKLLVYASKFSHEFDESNGFGWKYEVEPQHDWSTLIANKNAELQRLTGIYKNILKNANVTLIEGRGKVGGCHLSRFFIIKCIPQLNFVYPCFMNYIHYPFLV